MLGDMKPLAVLVRDKAAPVLRAHGYKRSGGTFRAITDNGVAVIQISGRRGLGIHDLDFDVAIGFTTHDELASSPGLVGLTAGKMQVGFGYSTWMDIVRDPGLTAMDGNESWRFDCGADNMEELFSTVLDMAAGDVLRRLAMWPRVPVDSFSSPPVFRVPVEREVRSRWGTNSTGELDLHYAATSPVDRRGGLSGSTKFSFDLVYDLEYSAAIIGIDGDAVRELAGGETLAHWAELVGFQSAADHATIPIGATPSQMHLDGMNGDGRLVIDSVGTFARAEFAMGQLPDPLLTDANCWGTSQIVLVGAETDQMHALTWRSRLRPAQDGHVWWATVAVADDS